jgi:hypothetical protein
MTAGVSRQANPMRAFAAESRSSTRGIANALLKRHFLPAARSASASAAAGQWQDALGRLVGLLLFCTCYDEWVEAHTLPRPVDGHSCCGARRS